MAPTYQYDTLAQTQVSPAQQIAAQEKVNLDLKNIQINTLKIGYPDLVLLSETESQSEYRLSMKIASQPEAPLYIKLIVPFGFPVVRPQLQIMSRVTHPNVVPTTFMYSGPLIDGWNEAATLSVLTKSLEDEFNRNPPMPEMN